MLAARLKEEEHLVVFFYEEGSIYAQRLLKELEVLDDKMDKNEIKFFKISDDDIDKDYDLEDMPALVYFHKTVPHVYQGDLRFVIQKLFNMQIPIVCYLTYQL